MTPRSAPKAPETDADKVVAAIEQLQTTTDRRLEILGDELSRIGDECRWVCNQLRDLLTHRFRAEPQEIGETVTCSNGCDAQIDSIADAVREGWKDLLSDPDGTSWNFLGTCPDCQMESPFEKPSTPIPEEAESATPTAGAEIVASPQGGMQDDRKAPGSAPAASNSSNSRSLDKPDLNSLAYAQCDVCDTELPIAEARQNGWTDLAQWNGGGKAAYLGICPGCISGEEEAPKVWEKSTVQCTTCDRKVSAVEARDQKWKKIARSKEDGEGAFRGQCPCCTGGKPKVSKNQKTLL